MAIQKRFIHFKKFSDFNSKKLSANEANTQYTIGVSGEVQTGAPDILYQSYCWIKDTKQQWTHGQLYSGGENFVYVTEFTLADCDAAIDNGGEMQIASSLIWDAVAANKIIFIPRGNAGGGCVALSSISDDYVYLTCVDNYNSVVYYIEVMSNDIAAVYSSPWRFQLKTINGQSLFGSNNIEIGSGEMNVQSDWLESSEINDSYVKNRTHYVEGTKITSAGNYNIGVNTPIYFQGKIFNLEVGVRTTITLNAAGVYVTLDEGGILYVEDAANYLAAFPIIAVSKIVPIDDGFIPETIVRTSELKTINGQTLVGSGDIIISGGGGSSAYSEVSHGTSDTTLTLTPNTFHIWDEVSSLTLTLGAETSGVANEYLFQFTSGSTATTLSLPDDIKWTGGDAPTIEANKIYQVSILRGLGSVLEWDNSPALIENKVTVSISGTKYLISLQYAAASNIIVKLKTVDGLISVNILSGEISKTASPTGPMIDSDAYIESITPVSDNNYNYIW